MTGIVALEVLAGARDESQALELSRLLSRCHLLACEEPSDHEAAAALYRACRRDGVTIRRSADLLIAAVAIRTDTPLLHLDSDFSAIAAHSALRLIDATKRSYPRPTGIIDRPGGVIGGARELASDVGDRLTPSPADEGDTCRHMTIAVDGPAGAGKSTVARSLAARLGFTYLDTGAMYRCVGLLALGSPAQAPAELARLAQIEFVAVSDAGASELRLRVVLDGRDVSEAIRAPEVSEAASRVATDLGVREALVAKQRQLISVGGWVAEGRDIATAVAPDAELKVYLTADPAERARRRAEELGGDQEIVMAEQALRDERDSTYGRSTLEPAPGAVVLDTTGLTVAQVVDRIAEMARRAG